MTPPDLPRPSVHFTAPAQWVNDPNGLVFHDGEYHLFFQLNPLGAVWGNMSWGHAVSTDLLRWRLLEPALTPYPARVADAVTMIFSGSALTSPSDPSQLLAFYTAHERVGDTPLNESVAMAVSADRGRTWARCAHNPVIDLDRPDFRDPCVFWHEPSSAFVMLIALPPERQIAIFRSADGLSWSLASVFSSTESAVNEMIWECPSLVAVPGDDGVEAWVLMLSASHARLGAPWSGMWHWIGTFDGRTFMSGTPARPVDHGRDFYAGITFNDLPEGQPPTMIAWASSWVYASQVPAQPWRGMMSLPRILAVVEGSDGPALAQAPAPQFDAQLGAPKDVDDASGVVLDAPLDLVVTGGSIEVCGSGTSLVTIEIALDSIRIRRASLPDVGSFEADDTIVRATSADVRIVIDHGIVEIFADHGMTTATTRFMPTPDAPTTVRLTSVRTIRRFC